MTAEITPIEDLRAARLARLSEENEIHEDVYELARPVTTEELLQISRATAFNLEQSLKASERENKRLHTNLRASQDYAKDCNEENMRLERQLRDKQELVDHQAGIIRDQDAMLQRAHADIAWYKTALEENHKTIDRLMVEQVDPWLADSGTAFVAFASDFALACGRAWHRLRKALGIYRRDTPFVHRRAG
jgi:hypothetical protein